MAKKQSPLMKPEAVADILQVARKTVVEMARRNDIPHVRIGRYYRFDPDEISRWIDRNRR